MRRSAIVSDVITRCADLSAYEEGLQRPQTLILTSDAMQRTRVGGYHVTGRCQRGRRGPAASAMRRSALVSVLLTRRADVSAYEEGQQRQQAITPLTRDAMQPPRVGGYPVLRRCQRVRRGPSASAGITPLTSDATQRYRVGQHHGQCRGQRVRRGPAASAGLTPPTSGAMQRQQA